MPQPGSFHISGRVFRCPFDQNVQELGYAVDETPFTVAEMMAADEVIVSSSGSFCLAAESIDGQPVGGKAPQMLKDLQDALVADFMDATAR